MHTRLFYGTIQSGKEQEALELLNEFVDRAKRLRGCLSTQLLQNGNEIVGISTWETSGGSLACPLLPPDHRGPGSRAPTIGDHGPSDSALTAASGWRLRR